MGFMAGNKSTSLMSKNTLSETKRRCEHESWNLTRRVGEEHDESVDTHSPASSGRETVFQPDNERVNQATSRSLGCADLRVHECLIYRLCLVVALFLLSGLTSYASDSLDGSSVWTYLFLETQSLLKGIVQLGVRIADFLSTQERLETFAQTGA